MTRLTRAIRRLPSLYVEVAAFCAVMAIATAIRIYRLGTVPRIVTADEADNLQVAYKIIEGTGPGVLGYDWKPAPIFSLYPLAWCIEVFGDTVSDFRMFPVILSLLTLIFTYLLARESMRAPAALIAVGLLATNLWFLHFSRTAWENSNAALFAVGACWCATRAIKTGDWTWWVRVGVFTAFGLYGYFTGRFIFVSVALIAVLAVLSIGAPWRKTLTGLLIAGVVTAVLFGPQARRISQDWERFNSRSEAASIFTGEYEGRTDGWEIAWINVGRNFRGFILQDGDEMGRGNWASYTPDHRPPLDTVSAYLFLLGLIFGAIRWRRTYAWWTFLIPVFIVEVFSKGTPDLARGILFAPFYFLFIGLFFDEVFSRLKPRAWRYGAIAAAAAFAAVIGWRNVDEYFDWQTSQSPQSARLPGVDICEFNEWRELAISSARQGSVIDPEDRDEIGARLDCSPVRQQQR